jgi:hypothetical protein
VNVPRINTSGNTTPKVTLARKLVLIGQNWDRVSASIITYLFFGAKRGVGFGPQRALRGSTGAAG